MYASDEDWKKDLDEIDKILDEIGKMEGKELLVRKICYLY